MGWQRMVRDTPGNGDCTSEKALPRTETSHKTIRVYLNTSFLSPPAQRRHSLNQSTDILVLSSMFFQGRRRGNGGPSRSGETGLTKADLCPDGVPPSAEAERPPPRVPPLRAGEDSHQPGRPLCKHQTPREIAAPRRLLLRTSPCRAKVTSYMAAGPRLTMTYSPAAMHEHSMGNL